jgi:hypothetical protein
MRYAIVLKLKYAPAWLRKARPERRAFNDRHIAPILEKYADRVSFRWFDAEAFHAAFSDWVLFETEDLRAYYHLIEELRDTPLITEGLAEFHEITLGLEWGHREFESAARPSS